MSFSVRISSSESPYFEPLGLGLFENHSSINAFSFFVWFSKSLVQIMIFLFAVSSTSFENIFFICFRRQEIEE